MKAQCFSCLNPGAVRAGRGTVIDADDESPTARLGYHQASPKGQGVPHADSSSESALSLAATQNASAVEVDNQESHEIPFDPKLPFQIPAPLNVSLLVVGTLGDVQPFIAIGEILRSHGHRVRLGTHEKYRKLVLEHNLEFAPLGADPEELSEFMVKHGGLLKPWKVTGMLQDLPRMSRIQKDIFESTWPAVCSDDFCATAIIANPPCWGHVHVAEKLGCPLHIMFPQPWVATKEFPHPATGWSVSGEASRLNKWSFRMMESLTWNPMATGVNKWRRETLGLKAISSRQGSQGLICTRKVPFSFLGSGALVPRPQDWPAHADIVGGISMPEAPYTPPQALADFLAAGQPPVLITFGSMRIQNPSAIGKRIRAAARRSNRRVVVQSGWSDLSQGVEADRLVLHLGKAPHSWLIPRMAAVVHHGGAGTTYAAAKGGKPMMVCPFFGDQPFWAHIVEKTGAGVKPVGIEALTEARLAEALVQLTSGTLQTNAEALMRRVLAEGDGAMNAVRSFYSNLAPADRSLKARMRRAFSHSLSSFKLSKGALPSHSNSLEDAQQQPQPQPQQHPDVEMI